MARTKKQETAVKPVATRAEKRDATKELIKEALKAGASKANEVIDNAAKLYAERYAGEDTENPNDVKGRVGSVLDRMKKEGEVVFEGGVYAMKTEFAQATTPAKVEEKPVKTAKTTGKRTAKKAVEPLKEAEKETEKQVEKAEEKTEEKPVKAKRTRAKKKTDEKTEEKEPQETVLPLPPAPLQPNAPVAPITPEIAPEPIPPADETQKSSPKKRTRKAKAETAVQTAEKTTAIETVEKTVEKTETPALIVEEKQMEEPALPEKQAQNEKNEQNEQPERQEKAEKPVASISSPKGTLMDMSFLFGEVKPVKKAEKPVERAVEKATEKPTEKVEKAEKAKKAEIKAPAKETAKEATPTPKKVEQPKQAQAEQPKRTQDARSQKSGQSARRTGTVKVQTADEKLQEAFLKRLHRLGGEYFEYYSVYLLEKYSRQNGRRLEGLKITAGDHDGGIDGEIELTDRLGFRETIYIQAKNWDPDKGDEKQWVVGETLLQQFIGACVCRQAKDCKQHCRGIFITTSRFTAEAKKMLDDTSDKFLGYDGADLYETAKECRFGLVEKDGEWKLDEELLSGTKAFFHM